MPNVIVVSGPGQIGQAIARRVGVGEHMVLSLLFPEGEAPRSRSGVARSRLHHPLADFMQLTKVPVIVYYGDNIPEQPSTNPARISGGSFSRSRGSGRTS